MISPLNDRIIFDAPLSRNLLDNRKTTENDTHTLPSGNDGFMGRATLAGAGHRSVLADVLANMAMTATRRPTRDEFTEFVIRPQLRIVYRCRNNL